MHDPAHVLITGASSGIGEALARAYARPGRRLALTGRDRARLDAVAEVCRARGAVVNAAAVDAADRTAMRNWMEAVDVPDLVIANAGISAGTGGGGETEDQARTIFRVNLDGVLNTIHPALDRMRSRPARAKALRGQIAIMSSLAGFRGFPGAPAYSASKAAVKIYGEALRGDLARDGIGVSVICPGFVVSRMTEGNAFRMPYLMPAERAADIIIAGLARDRPRIAFPLPTHFGAWLASVLPPAAVDPLIARFPRKARVRL